MAEPLIIYYTVSISFGDGVESFTVNGSTYTGTAILTLAAGTIITVTPNFVDGYMLDYFSVSGSKVTSSPLILSVNSSFSVGIYAKWARCVWINSTGSSSGWHEYIPWIYNGSKWVKAKPFIYNGSAWKEVGIE